MDSKLDQSSVSRNFILHIEIIAILYTDMNLVKEPNFLSVLSQKYSGFSVGSIFGNLLKNMMGVKNTIHVFGYNLIT